MQQAIQWPGGWQNVNGQTNQEFKFYKYLGNVAGGLGQPASAWATDGTTTQIKVGDTVVWYHPGADKIYDCSGASCTLQPFPLPGGHWGSPYRIYTLSGSTGDSIALDETVYFDRMHNSAWRSDYSLAASSASLGGVASMGARSTFKLSSSSCIDANGIRQGKWFKGDNGATCDQVCNAAAGRICDASKQSTLTSEAAVGAAFKEAGYECKSYHDARDYPGTPFSTGRNKDDCAPVKSGGKSVCNKNQEKPHSALCYCMPAGKGLGNDLG